MRVQFPDNLKEQREQIVDDEIRQDMVKLETLRDAIVEETCRDRYVKSYLEYGLFFSHSDCTSTDDNLQVSNDAKNRFEQQNPHHKVVKRTNVDRDRFQASVNLKPTRFQ